MEKPYHKKTWKMELKKKQFKKKKLFDKVFSSVDNRFYYLPDKSDFFREEEEREKIDGKELGGMYLKEWKEKVTEEQISAAKRELYKIKERIKEQEKEQKKGDEKELRYLVFLQKYIPHLEKLKNYTHDANVFFYILL